MQGWQGVCPSQSATEWYLSFACFVVSHLEGEVWVYVCSVCLVVCAARKRGVVHARRPLGSSVLLTPHPQSSMGKVVEGEQFGGHAVCLFQVTTCAFFRPFFVVPMVWRKNGFVQVRWPRCTVFFLTLPVLAQREGGGGVACFDGLVNMVPPLCELGLSSKPASRIAPLIRNSVGHVL